MLCNFEIKGKQEVIMYKVFHKYKCFIKKGTCFWSSIYEIWSLFDFHGQIDNLSLPSQNKNYVLKYY